MTRKVKLTRSEVEMAKHFGVPLEEAAKKKLAKRGRPAGSKNKPKIIKMLEVQVEEGRKKAVANTPKVDFKDLAEKLQDALARSYVECEQKDQAIKFYQTEITRRDVIIQYLESRLV